ncbi:MAG: carboxymuconolactone decarboxylase family protein [Ilumatobacteraceae bacterium]
MTARIPPLEPPFPEEAAVELAKMMPPGADPIGLFRTFAVNLPMTRAMQGWGSYELGRQLSLSLRQREILIDRTCARCGCEYEWGVHVAFFASRAGFDGEQVASLTHGSSTDDCWTDPADRLLIALADSVHDDNDVDDALWTDLSQHFSPAQLLDATMLCGWYHAISYTARAARVAPEPGAPRFADHLPGGR